MPARKYLKRDKSKDSLRHYTYDAAKTGATIFPDFDLHKVVAMIDNDPVASGHLAAFVAKAMEGDYAILKRDTMAYDASTELILDEKFRFRRDVIQKIFSLGKLFNNVFVEVRTINNETVGINVLDTLNIEPVTMPNGDPRAYRSRIPNPLTNERAMWTPDEIVWIKFGDRSVGYAPVDLKAVWETLLAKEFLTRFIAWLMKTGQYRVLYNPRNATADDIQSALTYMKKHDDQFNVPFIFKGELETRVLRDMRELDSMDKLWSRYNSDLLIGLRIPPIEAGLPDATGRSNADAQNNNFDAHITYVKKTVEDSINFDLFPKMNKGNSLLRFGPNNRFSEGAVFTNAQIMASMGMSPKAISEYMQDKGIFFKSPMFETPTPQEESTMNNPRDKDTAMSRQGLDQGEQRQQVGTGEQSTTREDQL